MPRCRYLFFLIAFLASLPLASAAQFAFSPGFTVSPSKINLTLHRGEEYRGVFQVVNRSTGPLPLAVILQNFAAKDEDGNIVFDQDIFAELVSPESRATSFAEFAPYNPRSWVVLERSSLLLDAGGFRQLPYTLRIPADAAYGTYLIAAVFQSKLPASGGPGASAEILPAVGALFFADVAPRPGEEPASPGRLDIPDFFIPDDAKVRFHPFSASVISALRLDRISLSFVERTPLTFVARLKNESRFIARPAGELRIRDMVGRQVGSVPFPSQAVLPDSTRRYTLSFASSLRLQSLALAPAFIRTSFLPGKYAGELTVRTSDGRIAARTLVFWAFPRLFVFGVILPMLAVLFLAFRYRRRIGGAAAAFLRTGERKN